MAGKVDLSQDAWRGLRPGMTRTEVVGVLRAGGAGFDDDPNDPGWLEVPGWGMELRFDFGDNDDGEEEGDSQTLRQIVLSDPESHWAGKPVIDQPLAKVFKAFGSLVEGCGWRAEHPQDDLGQASEEPGIHADEVLLGSGTLWMRKRPLGLALRNGVVKEIAWRHEDDAPRTFAGSLTPAQWAICEHPNGERYLEKWQPSGRTGTLEFMLTGIFAMSLIGIFVYGIQELQVWQAAPKVHARVTGLAPIRVEFTDATGKQQSTSLAEADFFIAPKAVGDEVEIRYLPTAPVRVKGPAREQDSFISSMPWAIGATAVYGSAMAGLGWLRRKKRSLAPLS